MVPKPFPNSYWVSPGELLAGEYPRTQQLTSSRERVEALLGSGVRVFLDLTERGELMPYADLIGPASHERFAIRDVSTPRSPEVMVEILDAIDGHIANGRTVYVHCWGGIGRTGTVVGCWLARHRGGGEQGLRELGERWSQCAKSAERQSPETLEQVEFVRAWEAGR